MIVKSRIDRRTRREKRAVHDIQIVNIVRLAIFIQNRSCRIISKADRAVSDVRLRRAEFVRRDKDFARKFPDDIRRREYRICADCSLNFSICSADACALPDCSACSSKQYRRFYSKLRGFRGAAKSSVVSQKSSECFAINSRVNPGAIAGAPAGLKALRRPIFRQTKYVPSEREIPTVPK